MNNTKPPTTADCPCTCHTDKYFDNPHLEICNPDGENQSHPYTHPTTADWHKLKEKLASIEHERWSDWQKWVHKQLQWNGKVWELSPAIVMRWGLQIDTPYNKLSDKEKASDMEQVDRYWPLIEQHIQQMEVEAIEKWWKGRVIPYAQDGKVDLSHFHKELSTLTTPKQPKNGDTTNE